MAFEANTSVQRLRALGLPTSTARELTALVQKWIAKSGEEWTVDRVKLIKQNLVRHFAGMPLQWPTDQTWIRHDKLGRPRGPFGYLFRSPPKQWKKLWNAVMIYTGLVFDHPSLKVTERQWRKAVSAIRRQPIPTDVHIEALQLVHGTPFPFRILPFAKEGAPLVDYQVRPTRRAPKERRTVPDEEGVLDSLRPLIRKTLWTTKNWDILSGTCRGLENSIIPALELNLEFEEKAGGVSEEEWVNEQPEMGLIALIQEAGYKLRFAANPYRVYQMALEPLKDALFSTLRRVPNDYTFDQNAGVEYVQQLLQAGLPAASMDLSNATDNMPLSLQLELMSRLGVPTRWLQFFKSTCRGEWWVNTLKPPLSRWELLQWTEGSPLGLGPTFASFALLHHVIVRNAFAQVGYDLDGDKLPYAVVGDDVVIADLRVAQVYRARMEALGVPISEGKSLLAPHTAEFLGRVIQPNQLIQGFKWKGRASDDSFVDFARNVGPGALLFMRPRQRKVISFIADLPEPYGLGWNPYGIPLEERLTPFLERIWARDERVRTFTRRSSRSHRLIYKSDDLQGRPLPGFELDAAFLADDQSADRVTAALLPGWVSWGDVVWPNLIEIARSSDLSPSISAEFRLMLQRSSSLETRKEVSTLVQLERKVRRAVARSL